MADSKSDSRVWEFVPPIARLRRAPWHAQVDVSRPQLGLHQLRLDEFAIDGQLAGVVPSGVTAWPAKVVDTYVRGHDLVATYEPTADWPYAPQLYWRAERLDTGQGVVTSVSLLVSVQTNLLDTHPRIEVASSLPADEVLRVAIADGEAAHVEALLGGERTIHPRADVCCVLRRLPGGRLSYAEFMPASDFRRLTVDLQPRPSARPNHTPSGGDCHTRWELFAEFLEKGVIRRVRLQLAVLDRAGDIELAAECCRTMKRRPLPLTT